MLKDTPAFLNLVAALFDLIGAVVGGGLDNQRRSKLNWLNVIPCGCGI